jgi:hypothetical protein
MLSVRRDHKGEKQMMRVAVIGVVILGLLGCDSAKWVDVPSALNCEQLEGMEAQKEMWGKAACLQVNKTYTGEVRCESGSNLQVKCK